MAVGREALQRCKVIRPAAAHERTERVVERHFGKLAREGKVEVFRLTGHPKAQLAYTWGDPVERQPREFTVVLGLPPVDSAKTAVKVVIAAHANKAPQGQQENHDKINCAALRGIINQAFESTEMIVN